MGARATRPQGGAGMTEDVRRHIQVARMKAAYVSNYSGWEVLEDGME